MKRVFSTATVGAIVAVIVLGLIVIDYRLLKKTNLSSSLRGSDIRNKVYEVDTMAIIMSKLNVMSKKIERLSDLLEGNKKKTNNTKNNMNNTKNSMNNTKKAKGDDQNVPKKEVRSEFNVLTNKNEEYEGHPLFRKKIYPVIMKDSDNMFKDDETKNEDVMSKKEPTNPLKGLFSLTDIIRNFEKERNIKKDKTDKENKFNNEDKQTPLFPETIPIKPNNLQNKTDMLNLVRSKFDDAIDLTEKRNKKVESVSSKYQDSPLFFHPIAEINGGPFDNISNLTDFTGSISSTFVSSKEIPGDDSKEVKSKVTSKVVLDLKGNPRSEKKKDENRLISESNKKNKLEDKSKTVNEVDEDMIKSKDENTKIGSSKDGSRSVLESKDENTKIGSSKDEDKSVEDKLINKVSNKFFDKSRDEEKSINMTNNKTDGSRDKPKEVLNKSKNKPKNKPNNNNKAQDNYNEKAIDNVLGQKSENSIQLEINRQVEQEHLQRDKEKRDNSLLNDFEQIEKEFNKKNKEIKESSQPVSPFAFKPSHIKKKKPATKGETHKKGLHKNRNSDVPTPFDNIVKTEPTEDINVNKPADDMNVSVNKPFSLKKIIVSAPKKHSLSDIDKTLREKTQDEKTIKDEDISYSSSSTKNEDFLNRPNDAGVIGSALKIQ